MLVAAVALIMHAWSPGDASISPRDRRATRMQAAGNRQSRGDRGRPRSGGRRHRRAPRSSPVPVGTSSRPSPDADGRFAVSIEPGIEVVVTVRASGFAEAHQDHPRRAPDATGLEFVLAPERMTEAVTVTATRGERRTSDVPASDQCARPRRHQAVSRSRGGRRPAADPDVQSLPPHEQPGVASDRAGRLSARRRPERRQPHARHARRRADQRSVRRVGLLVPDSARNRAAD